MVNIAFVYLFFTLVCGVFYRELTKYTAFTGSTTLAYVHAHLFVLGTIVMLILGLYVDRTNLGDLKQFRQFLRLYNISLPLMTVMMVVRGVVQVLQISLSKNMDVMISGLSGCTHLLMSVSLFFLYGAFRKITSNKE